MDEALRFVLYALALYRLTGLIVHDEGPGDMFLALRTRLGAYNYGPDGRPDTWPGRLISCPYCTGFWLGTLGYILFMLHLNSVDAIAAWLGFLGVMAWLEGSSDRN